MPNSSDLLSLYREWLEIPPHRLPPNHYALLGVDDFESDTKKIEAAAKSRGAYLHQLAAGPRRKIVQQMLSQVAIAKRTLLSAESKQAYDQTLRQAQTPEPSRDPLSPRQRTAGEWKYHAISAVVLLVIVAALYWANRESGGRRAAEVNGPVTHTPENVLSDNQMDLPENDSPRRASVRVATKQSAAKNSSVRDSRSAVSQQRSSGSGLSAQLDGKFADVLSDISKQKSTAESGSPKTPSASTGFRPLGGIAIGKVRKRVKQWPSGLVDVPGFPDAIEDQFESNSDFEWFDVEQGRLTINASDHRAAHTLSAPSLLLAKRSAVSLQTSIHKSSPDEVRVGFIVAGIQIGLRRQRKGIDVYVREQGNGSKPKSMAKINTGSKTATLVIERDSQRDDRLNWFVRTDDQDRAGSVDANLGERAAIEVFAVAPKKKSSIATWISDLKVREPEPEPETDER